MVRNTLLATVDDFRGTGGEAYIYATVKSENSKIGNAVQIWILPASDEIFGDDSRVCADCILRPKSQSTDASPSEGGCYVDGRTRAVMVRKIRSRNGIDVWDGSDTLFRGRFVRFGAWGDPVLIPLPIVQRIVGQCSGHTGYSHQWDKPEFQPYRHYFMASVHTLEQARKAHKLGWRYFLVPRGEDIPQSSLPVRTVLCPNTRIGITCQECQACDGAARGTHIVSIHNPAHGGAAGMSAWKGKAAVVTP